MRYLSLFSGIAGGDLGLQRICGLRCVGYVENNDYCQRTIARRIQDGILDNAPIYGDIRSFISEGWAALYMGMADLVAGGDPCQANSNAHRYGRTSKSLGGEYLEAVKVIRPRLVIRENPAHTRLDAPWPADRFADELDRMGYSSEVIRIRACCLGADHQRGRLFVLSRLADTNSKYVEVGQAHIKGKEPEAATPRGILVENGPANNAGNHRNYDGRAARLERFKALGNMQMPVMAATAFRILAGQ